MALFNWFKKKKKDQEVKVEERKQTVFQDSAAAAAFAEAGEHVTARTMMDKTKGNRKILVIGKEDSFSEILVNYSFDMAKRLDFELVMLNSTNGPLSMPEDRREESINLFQNKCTQNYCTLKELAEETGVPINHLVEIGELDDVVHKLQSQFPGMRYVLTEPDPEVVQKAKGLVSIPVFDLGSYHSALV